LLAAVECSENLGVLIAMAGVCHITLSLAQLLYPPLAVMLFPPILVPAFIGELSFAVWLIVTGAIVTRWQEQAGRSTASL
jgi:hypothetical protein